MLSAVIIVLREMLEVGLIVSVLLASARSLAISQRWIGIALVPGLLGAAALAYWMGAISDAFDGIGQELFNAGSLLLMVALLAVYNTAVVYYNHGSAAVRRPLLFWLSAATAVCAIAREGNEIIIYAYGFATSFAAFMPVLIGGGLGLGIGASVAALLYYLLIYLPSSRRCFTTAAVIVLVAAGMAAEAVLYLTQAGLISADRPLWDTSRLLAETSVLGQLAYALVGYEATPTGLQVGAYFATIAVMITAMAIAYRRRQHSQS